MARADVHGPTETAERRIGCGVCNRCHDDGLIFLPSKQIAKTTLGRQEASASLTWNRGVKADQATTRKLI